jgi:hypothetical protein
VEEILRLGVDSKVEDLGLVSEVFQVSMYKVSIYKALCLLQAVLVQRNKIGFFPLHVSLVIWS